jgi:hypothetical protein
MLPHYYNMDCLNGYMPIHKRDREIVAVGKYLQLAIFGGEI